MVLALSDHRQTSDYDCGAVTLRVLCDYWSVPLPAALSKLSNPVDGLPPETMVSALRTLRFDVFSGNLTVDLLKAITASGRPVATLIQIENRKDWIGHWVTVAGVGTKRVHYQCPSEGPTSLPINEWNGRWVDYHYLGSTFNRWGVVPYVMR